MFLNEGAQKWANIISEEYGVTDKNKQSWMAKYAQIHEAIESSRGINEGVDAGNAGAGIFATPLNTLGVGNPMLPQGVGYNKGTGIGNTGADFHHPTYKTGNDIPVSTLAMSMEIAAVTIGLELVPVIPITGPYAFLSFIDNPYAGGKLGAVNETIWDGKGKDGENKPIYVKFRMDGAALKAIKDAERESKIAKKDKLTITVGDKVLSGKYVGNSRIDNALIVRIDSVVNSALAETAENYNISISDLTSTFETTDDAAKSATVAFTGNSDVTIPEVKSFLVADLVSGVADHIQGFSNFFSEDEDPMTRAQNETGVGNTIGIRYFTKMVQTGSYEVTGAVTRQQLQDLPVYGIDVIGKILERMQNQISQEINNRILDRLFKLGTTNMENQIAIQGNSANLNLYLDASADAESFLEVNKFAAYRYMTNINGEKPEFGKVANAINMAGAENFITMQRRIMSRILAAANLITLVSRHGRPQFIVTNAQVLTALQDSAQFVVSPMTNTLTQDGSQSLYFAGSIAGLNVYVDPYMAWDDTRVLVGRKSNGEDPGVIFMPYILADTVQTVVEGTMAPKLLVNSRFAIVDAGFYPEQQYLTFAIESATGLL